MQGKHEIELRRGDRNSEDRNAKKQIPRSSMQKEVRFMVLVILRPYFFAATAVLWQQYAMDGIRSGGRESEADRPRPGERTDTDTCPALSLFLPR